MTTLENDWPVQLDLPGQVAAPAGPVDMQGMFLMHHAFRRDLRCFHAAAAATPVEDTVTWRALADRWAVFAKVLHHHHSGEDAGLWPLLMSRAGEEGRATLEAMAAEHLEIDPMLEACARGMDRLASGGDEQDRSALVGSLASAEESLGRHLAHEETDALALVQQHLTPADWERLEEEFFRPGLGVRDLATVVPWVAHGLDADIREQAFGNGDKGFRVLWLLTRRRFESRERRAFRYLPR